MKTKQLIFTILTASLVCILAVACKANADTPSKVNVDKDVIVAIYSTFNNEGVMDTVSPCLLEETVHVSELLHYSGDEGLTMPFNLSDTTKFAEITATNLDKRIVIVINGQVISTPVVKMRLDNGACSVVLDDVQVTKLFPNVNMEILKSKNR
mgnify:FL=1|jgi:Preprotein translocase subunit SecD